MPVASTKFRWGFFFFIVSRFQRFFFRTKTLLKILHPPEAVLAQLLARARYWWPALAASLVSGDNESDLNESDLKRFSF